MTGSQEIDEPSPTVVGPQPSGRGTGRKLSVPQGLERLLALAGTSPAWRAKVTADPLAAAREAGIPLSASETSVLGATPRPALEQMVASFARRVGTRLGASWRTGTAAVTAAALLAVGPDQASARAPSVGRPQADLAEDLGLINVAMGSRPDLPQVLVESASMIVVLRLKPPDAGGRVAAEVVRTIKGSDKAPDIGKSLVIDLNNPANAEHVKEFKRLIAELGDTPALMFAARSDDGGTNGILHLGGRWFSLHRGKANDPWKGAALNNDLQASWAGGTDMLMRLTELLVKFPDTDVPEGCDSSWQEPVKPGKVEGRVRAAMAVDIAGRGGRALFVASEGGDRIFAHDRKARKYEDATERLKLASKSSFVAWGDFTGGGRLDLASSDGKGLVIWSQGADGTFAATRVADVPKDACTGLAAIDVGQKGRAGLVWGSAAGPVLLVPEAGKAGVFTLKPLAAAPDAVKDRSGAGAPLVADFDGDGLPDIIQPFAKSSLFYKSKGRGEFAEGTACAIELGGGRTAAFLGDFDMDGRIDVMTLSEDCVRLWQNLGGGRFMNFLHLSGEIAYISRPGAVVGNVCDINNDGRPDVFLAYSDQGPQVFYNRGFRSFAHAHRPVDLAELNEFPEALKGQQAGVLADLDGDGAQDMALVLLDGTVWIFPQKVGDDPKLAVSVTLPPGGPTAGPVTVSAADDRMLLGAWVVAPGSAEAFFGRRCQGEVTITWQLPGEAPRKKTFALEDKPVRFVIGDDAK